MKVSRLPIDPGPAAWADLLPPAAPAQKLEGAQTADWLVIGGGFAGQCKYLGHLASEANGGAIGCDLVLVFGDASPIIF